MGKPKVQFYYREGCHLCDEMWHALEALHETAEFEIEMRDVDSQEAWKRDYGLLVPAITDTDRLICNYYLDPKSLLDHLNR